MQILAGSNAEVHFTHLSQSSCRTLNSLFAEDTKPNHKAPAFAHGEGVIDLMKNAGIPLDRVCLLDPKAENVLTPEDGDGRFSWFLFGVSKSLADFYFPVALVELMIHKFLFDP